MTTRSFDQIRRVLGVVGTRTAGRIAGALSGSDPLAAVGYWMFICGEKPRPVAPSTRKRVKGIVDEVAGTRQARAKQAKRRRCGGDPIDRLLHVDLGEPDMMTIALAADLADLSPVDLVCRLSTAIAAQAGDIVQHHGKSTALRCLRLMVGPLARRLRAVAVRSPEALAPAALEDAGRVLDLMARQRRAGA